jgi:hypothetical protein
MEILPPEQQRLWYGLRSAAKLGFVLYGGTAVALRLGHRASVDFDFFTEKPLDRGAMDDLMATKSKVILQHIEAKDYRDIAAMLNAGVSLPKGLAAARAMYGVNFQPSESLKAMVYFEGGDLSTLTQDEKNCIVSAVSRVRNLPRVEILDRRLTIF